MNTGEDRMIDRYLFLFGGGPPFNSTLGKEFA